MGSATVVLYGPVCSTSTCAKVAGVRYKCERRLSPAATRRPSSAPNPTVLRHLERHRRRVETV
eukprot:scaffold71_cov40-Prasinocladus_malaysianus.AAC.1